MSNIQKIASLLESGGKQNLELAYNLLLAFKPKERYVFLLNVHEKIVELRQKIMQENLSNSDPIYTNHSMLSKSLDNINNRFINSRYTPKEYTTLLIKEAAWDKKAHLKSVEHTVGKVHRHLREKPLLRAYISYVVDDLPKEDLITLLRSIKTTTVLDIPLKMEKEDPKELLNHALEMYTPLEDEHLGCLSKRIQLRLKLDSIIGWCKSKINE